MAQLDNRELLESVTRLVEKPDIRALELSLIATLGEIISAASIRFHRIQDNPDVPGQKLVICSGSSDGGSNPEPHEAVILETAPAFAECLRAQKKIVTSAGAGAGVRVIHPILTTQGVIGFLVIECERDDPKEQEIVSILLDFYKNYASLLHDTQRDELTGLLNRKTFDEKVLQIIAAQRSDAAAGNARGSACLAVVDIDHFKNVNDRFGHLYGDEILLLFAQVMIETFRGADLLFRVGGEEFVIVLRDVDLDRALMVLERFRKTVEEKTFPQVGTVTASIGASVIGANDLSTSIIDRADKALYYAKSNGRNQVHAYENLVAAGKLADAKHDSEAELF
jgi:diguanylate cyclase (GGDEF)-like protein